MEQKSRVILDLDFPKSSRISFNLCLKIQIIDLYLYIVFAKVSLLAQPPNIGNPPNLGAPAELSWMPPSIRFAPRCALRAYNVHT